MPPTARLEAEEANRAKSQFLATMSHELRTPLNAIGGYAQLMQLGIPEPMPAGHRVHLERLQAAQQSLLTQIAERGVAYRCDAPAGLRVRGDQEKARQVLVNLVANAVKFTADGGRVSLDVSLLDERRVAFRVRDSGIGIAPEMLPIIFEPFVQVDGGFSRRNGGTGLGLAISRELARSMGGDLLVTSVPGVGSEFTLLLPAA